MQPIFTQALSVETLEIAIAGLPPHLNGTTIVQLSDLHYDGQRLSDDLLMQAIDAANDAEPDLVVITGDFVTDDPTPISDLVLRLKLLQPSAGVYAILGNHDLYCRGSRAAIVDALTTIDAHVLWNQVAYPLGEGLALVGLADLWSAEYRQVAALMDQLPNIPRLVLAHNPDCAAWLQPWRVDLQLSGHTHGGQIILPGLGNVSVRCAQAYRYLPRRVKRRFPFLRACHRVMTHWEWVKGFHQVGNNRLYVNRGLGTYFPGRLFCPPEVTIIRLVRDDS
ncbi:metallophosphoesterase [Myxacorys almedinensis]|uniref:Metallophosphoesterase n=1 Tax=Myxacorys almedinensis A TaxID=2690445 RepID=A0A8J8CIA9_9CYAN|nr:metallophosphoesterase [Myxacorys almedinensis]NDJ17553.1 metallophosphoesterase [Myxacorys almedinensis A]